MTKSCCFGAPGTLSTHSRSSTVTYSAKETSRAAPISIVVKKGQVVAKEWKNAIKKYKRMNVSVLWLLTNAIDSSIVADIRFTSSNDSAARLRPSSAVSSVGATDAGGRVTDAIFTAYA